MSLTLTSTPVSGSIPNLQNVFPSFSEVLYLFSRQDTTVLSVSQAVDDRLSVIVSGDLSEISVGNSVYLFAEGVSFTYDDSFSVDSIVFSGALNQTTLILDGDFVQSAGSGYVNYKQNWLVEAQAIDLVTLQNVAGFSISDSGTSSGDVRIDMGVIGDKTSFTPLSFSGVNVDAGIQFKVKYRESWDDNRDESFTVISQEIILVYGTDDVVAESVANGFEKPFYYEGYSNYLNLIHSDSNSVGEKVVATYDTSNINSTDITTDNALHQFSSGDFGALTLVVSSISFAANEKGIRFNFDLMDVGDYDSSDYDSSDYDT